MKILLLILGNLLVGSITLTWGVGMMGQGLEQLNTKTMKKILTKYTSNVLSAFATGTVATALVQSSTAITVLTVSLVNGGLLTLTQAVGIIYGTNIGTTITAQLMSFPIMDLGVYALPLGICIYIVGRKKDLQHIGTTIIGLGFMFLGLKILNFSIPYIRNSQVAYTLFATYGQNPFIGLIVGMIATMLVHSSSATIGLTIVLFNTGLITYPSAIGLTLGDNIGTCITAQIASIGTHVSARRTAWAHTLYNIIGVLIALIFFRPFLQLVTKTTVFLGQSNERLIANTHTLFNIMSALLFLPITPYYVRLIRRIIPDRPKYAKSYRKHSLK